MKERLVCFTHATNCQPINIGFDFNVEREFDRVTPSARGQCDAIRLRGDAVRTLVHNPEKQAFDACFQHSGVMS